MKWRGRERSSNIEDRRGTTGGAGGGFGRGGGLGYNPFGTGGDFAFRRAGGRVALGSSVSSSSSSSSW